MNKGEASVPLKKFDACLGEASGWFLVSAYFVSAATARWICR